MIVDEVLNLFLLTCNKAKDYGTAKLGTKLPFSLFRMLSNVHALGSLGRRVSVSKIRTMLLFPMPLVYAVLRTFT